MVGENQQVVPIQLFEVKGQQSPWKVRAHRYSSCNPRHPPNRSHFEFDVNGIMKVCVNKGTGKSELITIKNEKGRLSDEEIEPMVTEAEDKVIRKKVEHAK